MSSGQTVQLSIGGGIDSRTDAKRVRGPNCLELLNLVFKGSGGYVTRNGYSRVSVTDQNLSLVSNPLALATRQDELLVFDGKYGYSYDPQTERFWRKGRITCLETTERAISETSSNQYTPDYVDNGSIRVTAWTDSSDSVVHYCVENSQTGLRYVENTVISGATRPRVVAAGDYIHLYYVVAASTRIDCKVFSLENTTGTTTTSVTGANPTYSTRVYDVDAVSDAVIIAFVEINGGNTYVKITERTFAGGTGSLSATTLASASTGTGTHNAEHLALDATDSYVWVAWTAASSGAATIYAYSTDRQFANLVTRSKASVTAECLDIVASTDAYEAWLFTSDLVTNPWADTSQCYPVSDSAIGTASWTMYHACVAGRGFYYNGYAHGVLAFTSPLQSTYYLVTNDRYVISRNMPGTAEGRPTLASHLPRSRSTDTGVFSCAGVSQTRLDISADADTATRNDFFSDKNIRLMTWDFTSKNAYKFVEYGNSTYILGGILWMYDGSCFSEAGFMQFPEGKPSPTANDQVVLSGDAGSNSFTYKFRYEWTNAQNERLRSGTISQTLSSVLPPAGSDLHVSAVISLGATNRDTTQFSTISNNTVVGYRSAQDANLDAGDGCFRCTSTDPSTSASNDGWINNTLSASTVSRSFARGDTSVYDNEFDYGNVEPENAFPGACSIIAAGNGRVFMAGSTLSPNVIYYSKLFKPGIALEFPSVYLKAPAEGGAITGLACLNDALVVFKERSIYVIAGDGPDRNGNGQFFEANLITSDTGLRRNGVVVRSPNGVMFTSPKGIYEVSQDYRVRYVGAPVEAWNDTEFVSALALQDQNHVRFMPADSSRALVYDYQENAWTTFSGVYGASAVVWDNTYVFLRSDTSRVFFETPDQYTDGGVTYNTKVRFPWYNPDGRQGYFRCKTISILGRYVSPHTMVVRCYYDYSDSSTEYSYSSSVISPNSDPGYGEDGYGDGYYGSDSVYNAQVWPTRQKCIGISIELELQPGEAGAGFELSDIALKVAQKHGPGKLASSKRIG